MKVTRPSTEITKQEPNGNTLGIAVHGKGCQIKISHQRRWLASRNTKQTKEKEGRQPD
jgi:hypothetical protein